MMIMISSTNIHPSANWSKSSPFADDLLITSKSRRTKKIGYLSTQELNTANISYKNSARSPLQGRISAIENKENHFKKSQLLSLSPFLDGQGIIRIAYVTQN